ncbi:MAG: hypothetical protein ACYSWO_08530 [Planctomycetota bacterium]|jgi:hypothetical protein
MLENTDAQVAKILEAVQAVTPEVAEQAVTAVLIQMTCVLAWVVPITLIALVVAVACFRGLVREDFDPNTGHAFGACVGGIAAFVGGIITTVCAYQIGCAILCPDYVATRAMIGMFGL